MPFSFDMSVVPNLVQLFRTLYNTIYFNYPDLLRIGHIVPVSTFFSLCYRITSKVMDKDTRDRFLMVKEKHLGMYVCMYVDVCLELWLKIAL